MTNLSKVVTSAALATAAGAGLATLVRSGLKPESQLFGRTLVAGNDPGEWALTYDDGPNPRSTPELLDTLARFQARATFFMIGSFVRQHPDLVRRVQAGGHTVGNHTMTHPFLATKSTALARQEIGDCSALLEDTLGAPVRLFRAPFGARRPSTLHLVRRMGLIPVQWNAQGNDWEPIGVQGILQHLERGLQRAKKEGRGANILLHDGFDERQGFDRSDTVRATEALLQRAAGEGNRMVPVDAWI